MAQTCDRQTDRHAHTQRQQHPNTRIRTPACEEEEEAHDDTNRGVIISNDHGEVWSLESDLAKVGTLEKWARPGMGRDSSSDRRSTSDMRFVCDAPCRDTLMLLRRLASCANSARYSRNEDEMLMCKCFPVLVCNPTFALIPRNALPLVFFL